MKNVKNLVKYVHENGGMTYNNKTRQMMTKGYVCAKKGNEFVVNGLLTEQILLEYVEKYHDDLQLDETCVGVWYNVENGKTYLDTSLVYDNLDECVEVGRRNGEIAIFCLHTFEEIRL